MKKEVNIQQLLSLLDSMSDLDYRVDRCKIHSVETIIMISLSAVLSGAETWNDIEDFGRSKEEFFKELLPGFNGVPSHDTICRFFAMINTARFEEIFRRWAQEIVGAHKGQIAIDGKTIHWYKEEKSATGKPAGRKVRERLHMVSAYALEYGICLGQVKTNEKSNEITAIPELLEAIDIKGSTITIDAMGCQKKIARTIIKEGGNYLLTVKDNQKTLRKEIESIMECARIKKRKTQYDYCQKVEYGHGREEIRQCHTFTDMCYLGKLRHEWEAIQSIGYIETRRVDFCSKKVSVQKKYFISSLPGKANLLLQVSRAHWNIENNLHWQLDVNFHEDLSRKVNQAAQNFSLLCKISLAILKNNPRKNPINRKRKMAGWNNDFLWELLGAL